MPSKLLKDGTVVTYDDASQSVKVLPRASILIVEDYVSSIFAEGEHADIPDGTEVIDVQGRIVTPGFVNTHVHSWMAVYRTMGPNVTLAGYFDWFSQMSAQATQAFRPEDVYVSALEGYLEGLNAGVTSCVEHAHNNWCYDVVEPGFDAALDSGARVWWCYDLQPSEKFPAEQQWDMLEKLKTKATSLVELGFSLDGTVGTSRGDLPDKIAHLAEISKKLDFKAYTVHHMGGPWPQAATSPAKLCEYDVQRAEIPVIFSHASFLTDEDIAQLRKHDLFMSVTPESECHYGHGQVTGMKVSDQTSLGTDTCFTFSGDILTQTRLWLQTVRNASYHKTLERGLIPRANPMAVEQAFLLATRQGGRAVRRKDIGVIQVGAKADLVVFNGDSPNMLGWRDPVAAVVLHANSGDVEHVLVDGRFRKRDFKLVDLKLAWSDVSSRFLDAARRIQPAVATAPPLPDKLWGVAEFGDVDISTTTRSK